MERKKIERIAKAAAGVSLVAASPLAGSCLLAANAYMSKAMRRDLRGGPALLMANAVLCLAAGAVSAAFSCTPVALAAAGALTWMFGRSREGPSGGGAEKPVQAPEGVKALPEYKGERLPPV